MDDADFATPAFVGRRRPWASYLPGILTLKGGRLAYTDHRGRVRMDEDASSLTLGELAEKAARFDVTTSGGRTYTCRFWDRSAYPSRPLLRSPLGVSVTGYDTTDRWASGDMASEWYLRLDQLIPEG